MKRSIFLKLFLCLSLISSNHLLHSNKFSPELINKCLIFGGAGLALIILISVGGRQNDLKQMESQQKLNAEINQTKVESAKQNASATKTETFCVFGGLAATLFGIYRVFAQQN